MRFSVEIFTFFLKYFTYRLKQFDLPQLSSLLDPPACRAASPRHFEWCNVFRRLPALHNQFSIYRGHIWWQRMGASEFAARAIYPMISTPHDLA